MIKILVLIASISVINFIPCFGQNPNLKIVYDIKTTKVKDQGHTLTCWSFATTSFLETEIIKNGGPGIDLSEWFVVRNIYPEKIRNYIRTQGNTYFTAGGQCQDVLWVLKHMGVVTEESYSGPRDNDGFNSTDLDAAISLFIKSIRENPEDIVKPNWEKSVDSILNEKIGVAPNKIIYNNKIINPKKLANLLNLNADDYIQLTSYTHHPFYSSFCLETRYNWAFDLYYNIPIDEMIKSIDTALAQGYSVCLNTDITNPEFDDALKNGINSKIPYVNQELRQLYFENGSTTIDHVMQITGLMIDSNGNKYYKTKNSWGNKFNEGYLYFSENYIREMGVSILLNKKASIFK